MDWHPFKWKKQCANYNNNFMLLFFPLPQFFLHQFQDELEFGMMVLKEGVTSKSEIQAKNYLNTEKNPPKTQPTYHTRCGQLI